MAEDETTLLLLAVVAVVAIVGLGIALVSFATDQSFGGMMSGGGGMMNRTTGSASTPGGVEWGVLIVSVVFLGLAVVLLVRARAVRDHAATQRPLAAPTPYVAAPTTSPAPAIPEPPVPAAASAPAQVPEPTLVKLLNEDERRMYLELRDHGGEMYQRDLVALGIFSKAKVTRVLDKLEAKGLIVREAHGMTNRVRLVNLPAR